MFAVWKKGGVFSKLMILFKAVCICHSYHDHYHLAITSTYMRAPTIMVPTSEAIVGHPLSLLNLKSSHLSITFILLFYSNFRIIASSFGTTKQFPIPYVVNVIAPTLSGNHTHIPEPPRRKKKPSSRLPMH